MLLLIILPIYFSKWNSRTSNILIQMKNHWPMLFYCFLFPLFLLVSIALTVRINFSAIVFDLRDGQINPGTFGAALTFRCAGVSGFSMTSSRSKSDSSSASQSSSLTFGLSKSPFQLSQLSASEMNQGGQSTSLSIGCRLISLIRHSFNIWVHPRTRSFEDKPGGWGDLSDKSNAAAPSWWKFGQNAITISSVSEMYPMVVICLFWAWDSLCVAQRFWLPCHISKRSWTLAILCNFLSSASLFSSMSFSALVVSNPGSSPADIPVLAPGYCLTTTPGRRVSPAVIDCLYPITSPPGEKLASTPTPCGMRDNMSCATLQRSAYIDHFSSCWCHQSVISGNQHVLLISIGSEW